MRRSFLGRRFSFFAGACASGESLDKVLPLCEQVPMTRYIIHLPPHMLSSARDKHKRFYNSLADYLRSGGGEVVYRERAFLRANPAYESDAFHFVHQGLVEMPNALNTGPSYLRNFWYADPKGVFGLSSLRDAEFNPEDLPRERVATFSDRLRKRFIEQRVSKHRQPELQTRFDAGAIAIFLQGESLPVLRAAFTDEASMVRALVAARGDREVLIKRHPRNDSAESFAEIVDLADQTEGVRIVDANVHDILSNAAVCASISSSVAVEAMLHRVPSLTFGLVDFHHCTEVVSDLERVPKSIDAAIERDWPFDHFLFWFFRHHCLELQSRDWLGKLNNRLGSFALDRKRLA